jgi:hypothetical protein
MDIKAGTGAVLPPGSVPPIATLPPGPVVITINSAVGENDGLFVRNEQGALVLENGEPIPAPSEHTMVQCSYPDGFVKNHQVVDAADLVAKVMNVLRFRYGVDGEIAVVSVPELTAGATIELEV